MTDLAKAKAKSINDGDIISVLLYIRSREKNATTGEGLLAGFVILRGTMLEKQVPDRLHPIEEVCTIAICSFRTAPHGRELV